MNEYWKSMDLVREVFSLAQGINGKYVIFQKMIPIRRAAVPDKLKQAKLEPNLWNFFMRIANLGRFCIFVNTWSEKFKQDSTCLIRHTFGKAVCDVLNDHIKMVTDLQQQAMPSWPGIQKLHAILMDEPLEKFKYIKVVICKVAEKFGTELLNELYELTAHGDKRILKMVQTIFATTVQPFFNCTHDWILQKSGHSEFVQFDLFLQPSEKSPKFLTYKTRKFIIKLEALLRTFKPVIEKSQNNWIELRIAFIFKEIPLDGELVKLNLILEHRLETVYQELNNLIRFEIERKQILQAILTQIELFFFSSDDCIEIICKRLKPNQLDLLVNILNKGEQRPTWDHICNELIKLDRIANCTSLSSCEQSFLVPIYFQNDPISLTLVNGNNRLDYLEIFIMLYVFKMNRKAILECWKKIRNFSSSFKLNEEISGKLKEIVYRIAYKLNEIMWIAWLKEEEMFSIVQLQLECFRQQIFCQDEMLKLNIIHQRFLIKIQVEIKTIISEQLHSIIELVPQLCKQVDSFIEVTQQFFRSNDNIWQSHKQKNIQLYRERLDMLGIVSFIDSICFQ